MSTAFERIRQGLQEAISHAQGNTAGTRVHHIPLHQKEVDVREVRSHLGMTQEQFASHFGFSAAAVRHWERGDRTPRGPALALLRVIACEPQVVMRALS